MLLIFHERTAQGKIRVRYISKQAAVLLTICKVGFPALIRQGLTSISNGLLNHMTKPYGDAAIAAMSVVNRYSALIMCVGLGVGQGFQPVAAFNYQARKYKRLKQGLFFTMIAGFALVFLLALPGIFFPKPIIHLFQESPVVQDVGAMALRYANLGVLFLPLSIPVNMLYQSIRKPGICSFLSLLRSGMALIPTLLIGTYLWGLTGIQIAQPIADMLTGLISIPFIIHFVKHTPDDE